MDKTAEIQNIDVLEFVGRLYNEVEQLIKK